MTVLTRHLTLRKAGRTANLYQGFAQEIRRPDLYYRVERRKWRLRRYQVVEVETSNTNNIIPLSISQIFERTEHG